MTPVKLVFLLVVLIKSSEEANQNKCVPRSYGRNKIVCVCNATYCDNLPQPPTVLNGQYLSYTSSQSGLRFDLTEGEFQSESESKADYTTITIDPTERYQTIIGWGGSFTDAAGININSLSSTAADYLLKSYFSEDGLEYNLCRVPIGGTDFSTHGYSYNDGEEDDLDLTNFKLAPEDHKYKIPVIKAAQNLTNGKLELFASAWTAPKWMKNNGKYTGPDTLKKEMYQAWANYHIKFLEAYKAEGLNFWGITTGNEPSTGLVPSLINSVGWLPWQMRDWVAEHFGPAIRNSEFSSLKILTVDDQAFFYPLYIDMMFTDEKVKDYIDGFALHWYWNTFFPPSLLTKTHNKYPDKLILATEACAGSKFFEAAVSLGDWRRAQGYAKDIMDDLQNWVTGWVDWNMALDPTGGPTYIDNNVDSPIIVNASAGEFYKQPMYYALGHFSKFIPKGSERLSVTQSDKEVEIVAFSRPDNETVVVILNTKRYDVPIKVIDPINGEITKTVPGKSIITLLY